MTENATDFERELKRSVGKYVRMRRVNGFFGELMTWGAVFTSLGLTACLALDSLGRFDAAMLKLVITVLAPLPAVFLTLSLGLGFNARCAWYDKKCVMLMRLLRALKYEDLKPQEASKRWSEIDENLQQSWGDFLATRQPNMPERPGLKIATV